MWFLGKVLLTILLTVAVPFLALGVAVLLLGEGAAGFWRGLKAEVFSCGLGSAYRAIWTR